jgi:hypothetical protein
MEEKEAVLIYMEIFDAVSVFAFVFERDTDRNRNRVVWCVNAEDTAIRKNQAGDVFYFCFQLFFFASRIQSNNKILQKISNLFGRDTRLGLVGLGSSKVHLFSFCKSDGTFVFSLFFFFFFFWLR